MGRKLMKRKELAPQAEHLYVYEQKEFTEIAKTVGVNERTLRTWAKRDHWKEKRENYLRSKEALKYELIDFTRSLLRDVKEDYAAGEEPSRTKVNLLSRFGYMIVPPSEFKNESPAEPEEKPQQDPLEAVRQFLGL